MQHRVDIITVPARSFAAVRSSVTDVTDIERVMMSSFGTVEAAAARAGRTIAGPAVALYTQTPEGFEVDAGFPLAGEGVPDDDDAVVAVDLPGAEVMTTSHLGAYDTLPEAYEALRAGAVALGRELDEGAPMWEEYVSPPSAPPENTRTNVFWPVKPG
jgi:effector-binding domain-containing protein